MYAAGNLGNMLLMHMMLYLNVLSCRNLYIGATHSDAFISFIFRSNSSFELNFFEQNDFSKTSTKLHIQKTVDFSITPHLNPPNIASYVPGNPNLRKFANQNWRQGLDKHVHSDNDASEWDNLGQFRRLLETDG